MAAPILPGESARRSSRAVDLDGSVTLPYEVVCELLFVAAQLRSRLELRAGNTPGRIDRQIIENAGYATANVRAALELARRRPRSSAIPAGLTD